MTASSQLNAIWAICKNELTHYFFTPIAYVFLVIFLVGMGTFTFFVGGFFTRGQASLDAFFQFHPWLYLFLVPAFAMRLWAEERKSGSIEVLLTLPVTILSAVLGKLLAAWMVLGLALLLTTTFWFSINYLGSPDNAAIVTGYAGSFVMAGSYLAVSAFASALTRNQVVAFIIAVVVCLLFTASGLGLVLELLSGWAPSMVLDTVSNLSFLEHFQPVSRGVIDLGDAVFFTSTILVFVFANVVAVNRWKNG
ncbi:MAG: ABC transporter permease [Gammaproteobacteria bacterium]|nr:ABC transporter permease [Gammaproteobacteria bacterium]